MKRRLAELRMDRVQFEPWWAELAQYFKPSQTRYAITGATAGQRYKGSRMNTKVVRNTPFMARRVFVAGMMSGLTSPARPWFRLVTPDPALSEYGPVKRWLHVVEMRMREVFAKGNLYNALPTMYASLGTFATSAMLALEDDDDLLRFYVQPIGTYWLSQSARGVIDSIVRQYPMTVRQIVEEFGTDRLSVRTQNLVRDKKWEQQIDILHSIEPTPRTEFKSCYIELGCDDRDVLAERRYNESPLIAPRWEVDPEDVYGTDCPGMLALGPARALMVQERRKAQAIDKMVAPPLLAPVGLRNALIDNVAGGVTYYDIAQGREGVKSLYDVRPDINALVADIAETGAEIDEAFYTDMFLAISRMEGVQPRNEMEIFERKEEKLLQLGPALERMNDECLDPLIDRTFAVMVRRSEPYWRGLLDGDPVLPPPPPELQGLPLRVEYISVLAQAMRTIGISGIERTIAFVGNIAAQTGSTAVWDKLDTDQAIDEYAAMTGVSPLIVRDDEVVASMRDSRAQQAAAAQAQQSADTLNTMAGAVKQLGDTPVSGDTVLGKLAGVA